MKRWIQRMGERLARMMYGRYGNDALNHFLLIAGLVFLLLSYVPYLRVCLLISLALITWSNIRFFSRRIYKRRQELMRFATIEK